jgi:hypothetical protein
VILVACTIWAIVAVMMFVGGKRSYCAPLANIIFSGLWPISLPITFIAGALGYFNDDLEIEE